MNRRSLLALFGLSPVVAVASVPDDSGRKIDACGAMLTEAQFRAILDENNARLRAELPGYIVSQKRRSG